jgi:hypothetical protein
MSKLLEWRGDLIADLVERAAAEATRETVDDAVEGARADTPVETGRARDSIRRENEGLSISWGYHIRYGIWIEIGARGRAGVHAMRRNADRAYAGLTGRIRRRLA